MGQKEEVNKKEIKSYLDWSDKGKSSIFRYVIGLILIIFAFYMLSAIGIIPITLIYPEYQSSMVGSTLVLLAAFIIPFIAIPLITQIVHKRPYWSVAMPKLHFEKWNLFVGFIVSTLIGVIMIVIFGLLGLFDLIYVGFDWKNFIPLAIVGTIGIFIQASTEEMLFRGYLTQFVRRITKNPIIFIAIPTLLFALPHISNVSKLGGGLLVLVPYFISGLLYAWVAYKTGSLWMAIGLHWSNNLSNLILFGVKGDVLKSVAPIQFDSPNLILSTVIILLQSVTTVIIISYLLKRRARVNKVISK